MKSKPKVVMRRLTATDSNRWLRRPDGNNAWLPAAADCCHRRFPRIEVNGPEFDRKLIKLPTPVNFTIGADGPVMFTRQDRRTDGPRPKELSGDAG